MLWVATSCAQLAFFLAALFRTAAAATVELSPRLGASGCVTTTSPAKERPPAHLVRRMSAGRILDLDARSADVLREILDDVLVPGVELRFLAAQRVVPEDIAGAVTEGARSGSVSRFLRQGHSQPKLQQGAKNCSRELESESFGRDGWQPRAGCIAKKALQTHVVLT